MINGSWIAQACYVMTRLGVADLMGSGVRSIEELAARSGRMRLRCGDLLNALCSVELCVQREDGTFELTELPARCCGRDHPSSVSAWAQHWGGVRGGRGDI